MFIDDMLARDIFPEWAIRWGIREFLKKKTRTETEPTIELQQQRLMRFVEELRQSPIAIETQAANEQHYEVPSEFFLKVLGPRLKYSCGWWDANATTLAQSEEAMLQLYCERSGVQDGMRILDLGCGWGSLSLWLAEKYPNATITGLSNSRTQKQFIDGRAKEKGFNNLTILTGNIAEYEMQASFDRIFSIEMMEHMKNYAALFQKVSGWMAPDAKLFVHIFTHRFFAYHYEDKDGTDWMTRYFFSGGTMPSADLFHYFQEHLILENQWAVSGAHYEKTSNAWLENMHRHEKELKPLLASTYGEAEMTRWWVYWKVFFMACAELWGYHGGDEWFVSHYLFHKRS